jgi:16S rRNA (cytosine967-C5)-methyltransferase
VTPAARLSAAIEILDAVIAAARDEGPAADTIIARYFKDRRYAGSKDRRAVRELVFEAIRTLGERPETGRAAMLGFASAEAPELLSLFGGDGHAPAAIDDDEPSAASGFAPQWLIHRLRARFGDTAQAELAALLGRAPLDLRVNTLMASRSDPFDWPVPVSPTPFAPNGLRSSEPFNVEQSPLFLGGAVEVQDEGSQLACLATSAAPDMTVIDLCAGAGGKSLAIAAAMANRGRLIAADTNRDRLQRLPPRAERAGASIIEILLLNPGKELEGLADHIRRADLVLVDAPCSGTGTWRRNPEARWRLTPERLARLTALQARLLDIGAALVRPGGRLVYVVCSLLPEEGDGQIDAFLAANPGWTPSPFTLPTGPAATGRAVLSPARHGTDGFFIAGMTAI